MKTITTVHKNVLRLQEGCKDLDDTPPMVCSSQASTSMEKQFNRKKRMRKVDLLAIKLMHTMQVGLSITLACHFLEEEGDKRSLRSITTEI